MAAKKCCIDNCYSRSTRVEDIGVTYHKFPKVHPVQNAWVTATQCKEHIENTLQYVCSRHFCKIDFQKISNTKYVLKPDAVPSIFPWNIVSKFKMENKETQEEIPAVESKEEDSSHNKISEKTSNPLIDTTNTSPNDIDNTLSKELLNLTPTKTHSYDIHIKEEVVSPVKEVLPSEPENKTGERSLPEAETVNAIKRLIENQEHIEERSLNIKCESEVDSVNAIKRFIENEEQEIESLKSEIQGNKLSRLKIVKLETLEADIEKANNFEDDKSLNIENSVESTHSKYTINNETLNFKIEDVSTVSEDKSILESKMNESSESFDIASNVMNIILSESESKIHMKRKDLKKLNKLSFSPEKGSAMTISVGSKVEAKDFSESWHTAQILEVDFEEMEVLVHYENVTNRTDEWISVSSPRLRPRRPHSVSGSPLITTIKTEKADSPKVIKQEYSSSQKVEPLRPVIQETPIRLKEEPKEEKMKLTFEIGERCLVRYKNNMRFAATVTSDLGEDQYQITFDDGFKWNCNVSRIIKWKDNASNILPASVVPHTKAAPVPNLPYHTHLFDPTRDYLGSKTERREKKRKLNIKEIFNIGMGKKRCDSEEKPTRALRTQKRNMESLAGTVKKKVKAEPPAESEIKKEIPDAVASIIGTVEEKTLENELDVFVKQVHLSKEEVISPNSSVVSNVEESSLDIDNSKLKIEVDKDNITVENDSEVDSKRRESVDLIQPSDIVQESTMSEDDVSLIEVNPDKDLDEESLDIDEMDVKNEIEEKQAKEIKQETEVKVSKRREPIVKLEDCLVKAEQNVKIMKKANMSESEIKHNKSLQQTDSTKKSGILETLVLPLKNESKDKETKESKDKDMSKMKKKKKLKLIREKKVKQQVEKVKSELEEMKKQVDEMKKQIMLKTEELAKDPNQRPEFPESFLLPGEWCCKWVNGQPVGIVSEIEFDRNVSLCPDAKPPLPRRSVQVEDKRLPPGWTKLMVRRSVGSSAGKWDVVLISPEPECRRFHAKSEIAKYLESQKEHSLKPYEKALQDFGIHLKLARRMGWVTETPVSESPVLRGTLPSTSPGVKRKKLSLNKQNTKFKKKDNRRFNKFTKRSKAKAPPPRPIDAAKMVPVTEDAQTLAAPSFAVDNQQHVPSLQDGFVYVGSLKVQIIMNLLRCPADGCFKNFRTDILLQMHIKHYHPELTSLLGATPNVIDLASARAMPTEDEIIKKETEHKVGKVRVHKPKKEGLNEHSFSPFDDEPLSRSLDSPFSNALNRPAKRPKVLLPVRKPEDNVNDDQANDSESNMDTEMPDMEPLDFETAISTHTVTKPIFNTKKKRTFAKAMTSEDDMNSDLETRSSFHGSDTPDSRTNDAKIEPYGQMVSSESNEDQREQRFYTYTENGDRIKIEHMKREEIINCHCGIREEDGLMVQCELCLCWQHALCHNITNEALVPEKYTCSICLNPRRGRRSKRFLHDQDRLYEGLLPGSKPCEWLRRSHELSGNLLRIQDALHALRVKYYVATKKDHPKLYLWAKDWDSNELSIIQEKFNSDYSDLNIMINAIGKENLPMKPVDVKDVTMGMRTPPSEEQDRYSQREPQIGPQSLLSGLLSSPSGGSLDLPITASELEKLAKSVQEQEVKGELTAPQPEAAIDDNVCREHLLKHIKRCQALIDARFDSIEAQVAELESQDPSLEDDETADYFPRTKQTVQMLIRDLDVMEELGIIT